MWGSFHNDKIDGMPTSSSMASFCSRPSPIGAPTCMQWGWSGHLKRRLDSRNLALWLKCIESQKYTEAIFWWHGCNHHAMQDFHQSCSTTGTSKSSLVRRSLSGVSLGDSPSWMLLKSLPHGVRLEEWIRLDGTDSLKQATENAPA